MPLRGTLDSCSGGGTLPARERVNGLFAVWIRRSQQPNLPWSPLGLPYLRQADRQHERLRRAPRQQLLLALHFPGMLRVSGWAGRPGSVTASLVAWGVII